MKTCTVFGDMQSDSAAEQYPTVTLCNDCVEQDALAKEDNQIVSQEPTTSPSATAVSGAEPQPRKRVPRSNR